MSGKKAKALRAARPAKTEPPQPQRLGQLTRAELEDYRQMLADGNAAALAFDQARQVYLAANERVVEERGAIFSFARRISARRGLDLRGIIIQPDGRIVPAIAALPPAPTGDGVPGGDQTPGEGDAATIAADAIAEINKADQVA